MYKAIDKVLTVIEWIIVCIIAVLAITWLLKLNNLSQFEQVAFEADRMVNGDAVAFFRSFKDNAKEVADIFMNLI